MSAVPLSSPRRCAPCLSSLRSMSVIAASPSNLPIARRRCSSRAGGFSSLFNRISDPGLSIIDEDMTQRKALEGLGGPMTRARAKQAKEALQLLVASLQDEGASFKEPFLKVVLCLKQEGEDGSMTINETQLPSMQQAS